MVLMNPLNKNLIIVASNFSNQSVNFPDHMRIVSASPAPKIIYESELPNFDKQDQ